MDYNRKYNSHDLFYKKCMEKLSFAKCFYRHYLPKELLQSIEFDSLVNCRTSFIDSQLRLREADVLYKAKFANSNRSIFLLTEHFSYYYELAGFRTHCYKLATMSNHIKLYSKWKICLTASLVSSGFANLSGNNVLLTNQNTIYFVSNGNLLRYPDSKELVIATLNSRCGLSQVTRNKTLHNNQHKAKLLFKEIAKLPNMPELNTQRLPMVIATVVSHNKDGRELPLDLTSMIDSPPQLQHLLPQSAVAIGVNLHKYSAEQLSFQPGSGFGLFALKQVQAGGFDKSQFVYIENHVLELVAKQDYELLNTIVGYILSLGEIADKPAFLKLINKLVNKAEGLEMGTMAQHWRDEGIEQGIEQGIKRGKSEGILEGIVTGKKTATRDMARKMLEEGVNPEVVKKITSLEMSDIEN